MKIKNLLFFALCLISLASYADDKGHFYALTEAGQTKITAASSSSYSISSNSWDVGIGYEAGNHQLEFTAGSAFSLSASSGDSTSSINFSNSILVYHYKIINSGNFRPFIGFGRYGGTLSVTGSTDEAYSRNIYDLGIEVPLDDNSSVRFKYLKSLEVTGYASFSAFNVGLLYRF